MRKTFSKKGKRVKKAGTKKKSGKEIELASISLSESFQGMPNIDDSYFSIEKDLAKLESVYRTTDRAREKRDQALSDYTEKLNHHNDERRHFSNLQHYGMAATKQEKKELKQTGKLAAKAEEHLSKATQELKKAIEEEEKTIKAFKKGTVKRSSGGRRKNRKSKKR